MKRPLNHKTAKEKRRALNKQENGMWGSAGFKSYFRRKKLYKMAYYF